MAKKDEYIVFNHALGKTTLHPSVKDWSFEQLEKTYKGVLDYVSLANQLGIKPAAKGKAETKTESEK